MKYALGAILATVIWILLLFLIPFPEGRIYDCGMAEWHPDIPPNVKEECRKMRMQNKKDIVTI